MPWTREPMPPTLEGSAFMSSGTIVLVSRPAKPLSISRAFLPHWLTVCHQRDLRVSPCPDKHCFWWGCSIMFTLRMLVAHSDRVLIRSLSVPATNCLMTLGCAVARMHADKGCRGWCQGHGHGDNGTSLLQQQQPWCCYCDPHHCCCCCCRQRRRCPSLSPM